MTPADRGNGELPLHVYFAPGLTPEQAVLVIESLSRMVRVPLEIAASEPGAGPLPHLALVPR